MSTTPPSLYAAFGRQEPALSRGCRSSMVRPTAPSPAKALSEEPSARRAIEPILREAVLWSIPRALGPPRGCMLTTGALTCAPEHKDVATDLARRRLTATATIQGPVRQGHPRGRLDTATDTAALAALLLRRGSGSLDPGARRRRAARSSNRSRNPPSASGQTEICIMTLRKKPSFTTRVSERSGRGEARPRGLAWRHHDASGYRAGQLPAGPSVGRHRSRRVQRDAWRRDVAGTTQRLQVPSSRRPSSTMSFPSGPPSMRMTRASCGEKVGDLPLRGGRIQNRIVVPHLRSRFRPASPIHTSCKAQPSMIHRKVTAPIVLR